jgi:hypothetical protein
MTKLIRDKRTGDYYTEDKQYLIEKGTKGWNVNELDESLTKLTGENIYRYGFTCETLRDVRESI